MNHFERYIGIDYSGASTPDARLPGLRVYVAEGHALPREIRPEADPRKHWSRRALAHWLAETLRDGRPAITGVDHAFSFPLRYFLHHGVSQNWDDFLEDFCAHCPSEQKDVTIDALRSMQDRLALRAGDARWRRTVEVLAGGAKSVFHFGVPGSVAKSTHAGLPWLRQLRDGMKERLHVWPFDGWRPAPGTSVIAEVYPALWSGDFPREGLTGDQRDAYAISSWLQRADAKGTLASALKPELTDEEKSAAAIEGWILGVTWSLSPHARWLAGSGGH